MESTLTKHIKEIMDQSGTYRLEIDRGNCWQSIVRDGKVLKFKTPGTAIMVRMSMGLPKDKCRIIDEIRGRQVKI